VRSAIAAIVAALAFGALTAGAATRSLVHVTLIGDSVADGIAGDSYAIQTVSNGVDLDLETAACRRIDGTSCPPGPPTLVDLVHSLGSKIGPVVVVAVGYNDFENEYAGEIQTALADLKAVGVQRVFWLTLRASRHPYLSMNDDIEAAAQQDPEMTVIDWNVYSRSHPDWFQPDGIHLVAGGSEAMATLIHNALLAAHVAVPPPVITTARLPTAHERKPYRAKLAAAGGDPPYRFSLLDRPPLGIHLLPGGVLTGAPRGNAGPFSLRFQVKDSDGVTGTRTVTLRVAK